MAGSAAGRSRKMRLAAILLLSLAVVDGFSPLTCLLPGLRPRAPPLSLRQARRGLSLGGAAGGGADDGGDRSPAKGNAFTEADAELVKAMSEAEAADGNSTGAEMYRSIADRMDDIMSRSSSRMSASLSVSSSASSTPSDSSSDTEDEDQGIEQEPSKWTYVNERLSAIGSSVWFLPPKDSAPTEPMPLTAKTLDSYETGAVVSWKVKVNERTGPLFVGLTSLSVGVGSRWRADQAANEAYFLTEQGNLFNGGEIVAEGVRGGAFGPGDTVTVRLDGDGVYFAVNGVELEACIKPVVGTLRLSVCLTTAGDGVDFLDQDVVREAAPEVPIPAAGGGGGAAASTVLGRSTAVSAKDTSTLTRSIDDESASLLEGLISGSEAYNEASSSTGGWSELVDDATGTPYWWNEATDESTWERPAAFNPARPGGGGLELDTATEKALGETVEEGGELYANFDASKDSHTAVEKDEYGNPTLDRFVYVDEVTCIGCTNCATVARSTFYMHEDFGRARAFRQGGDTNEMIEEAVATCPVDCIWYVSWDDLVILESERRDQVINPASRLVGGNFIEATQVQTYYNNKGGKSGTSGASIMQSGAMRCNNCPGRGCKQCPLFGVGENPEFMRKKQQREARRKARKERGNKITLGAIEDAVFDAVGAGDETTTDDTWDESITETTE